MYGPIGITVSMLLGIFRIFICNPDYNVDLIPVDFTVNALIVSAWDIFNNRHRYDHVSRIKKTQAFVIPNKFFEVKRYLLLKRFINRYLD